MNYWHVPTNNPYIVVIHQCPSCLFLDQLEEHVTYLVCEVEFTKLKKNKNQISFLNNHLLSTSSVSWGPQLRNLDVFPDVFSFCTFSGVCDSGYTNENGICYKYFSPKKEFDDAEAHCVSEGGHVISVTSDAENEFLKDFG